MSVDDFLHLLHRYSGQDCSPDEMALIDRWYDRLRSELEPRLTTDERASLQRYLWQRIERRIDATSGEEHKQTGIRPIGASRRQWPVQRWAVAAVVVVLGMGAAGAFWFSGNALTGSPQNADKHSLSVFSKASPANWENDSRKPQLITLNDGSIVQLEPGAKLHALAKTNSQKREVWLTGRAFFSVKRDETKPFLVYAGTVVTRVLGTSFWVNAPLNAPAVDVSVRTGKVWVARLATYTLYTQTTPDSKQGVMLTPNQQVTFYTTKSQWAMGLVAKPQPLKIENDKAPAHFSFDETSLKDVLKTLENQYGIAISAPDKTLEHCRFTGDISQQPFYTQLEFICRSINASYELIGTQIVVSGPGCSPY
ncbi:MAG: FecR family protein [Rudanella sp.]|nr:FecR family protein [Rudanella sp.]